MLNGFPMLFLFQILDFHSSPVEFFKFLCFAQSVWHKKQKFSKLTAKLKKNSTEKPWKNHQHQGEMTTDFFPAGRTRYPGRNAEEKTIHVAIW